MSVAENVVSEFAPTGTGFAPLVGLLPHPSRPERASELRRVAEKMKGRWGHTFPILLADGGEDDSLRVVFACADDIDPVVTLRLHLAWAGGNGPFVRVYALCDNMDGTSEDFGEPWGHLDPALEDWFQATMDQLMGYVQEVTGADSWRKPVAFGDTSGIFAGDHADPHID